MCVIVFVHIKCITTYCLEFHIDMLRMWEETSPFHNIDYGIDIDEETEMEVSDKNNMFSCNNSIATLWLC